MLLEQDAVICKMLNALSMFLLMYYTTSRSRSHTGKQGPGVETDAEVKQNDPASKCILGIEAAWSPYIPEDKCTETEKNNNSCVIQFKEIFHLNLHWNVFTFGANQDARIRLERLFSVNSGLSSLRIKHLTTESTW